MWRGDHPVFGAHSGTTRQQCLRPILYDPGEIICFLMNFQAYQRYTAAVDMDARLHDDIDCTQQTAGGRLRVASHYRVHPRCITNLSVDRQLHLDGDSACQAARGLPSKVKMTVLCPFFLRSLSLRLSNVSNSEAAASCIRARTTAVVPA